jgi:hypothetical protein
MSFPAVMRLALDQPRLLPIVQAAYLLALENGNRFSGSAVLASSETTGVRNLTVLSRRDIVVKTGTSPRGDTAYYAFPDLSGTAQALRELHLL